MPLAARIRRSRGGPSQAPCVDDRVRRPARLSAGAPWTGSFPEPVARWRSTHDESPRDRLPDRCPWTVHHRLHPLWPARAAGDRVAAGARSGGALPQRRRLLRETGGDRRRHPAAQGSQGSGQRPAQELDHRRPAYGSRGERVDAAGSADVGAGGARHPRAGAREPRRGARSAARHRGGARHDPRRHGGSGRPGRANRRGAGSDHAGSRRRVRLTVARHRSQGDADGGQGAEGRAAQQGQGRDAEGWRPRAAVSPSPRRYGRGGDVSAGGGGHPPQQHGHPRPGGELRGGGADVEADVPGSAPRGGQGRGAPAGLGRGRQHQRRAMARREALAHRRCAHRLPLRLAHPASGVARGSLRAGASPPGPGRGGRDDVRKRRRGRRGLRGRQRRRWRRRRGFGGLRSSRRQARLRCDARRTAASAAGRIRPSGEEEEQGVGEARSEQAWLRWLRRYDDRNRRRRAPDVDARGLAQEHRGAGAGEPGERPDPLRHRHADHGAGWQRHHGRDRQPAGRGGGSVPVRPAGWRR